MAATLNALSLSFCCTHRSEAIKYEATATRENAQYTHVAIEKCDQQTQATEWLDAHIFMEYENQREEMEEEMNKVQEELLEAEEMMGHRDTYKISKRSGDRGMTICRCSSSLKSSSADSKRRCCVCAVPLPGKCCISTADARIGKMPNLRNFAGNVRAKGPCLILRDRRSP